MKPEIKKKIFLALRLTISAALIFLIFREVSAREDLSGLVNYYYGAGYGWLAGAAALLFLLLGAGSWRWGMLLAAQGIHLRPASVFMYYMIGFFFNHFLPTTVGGDVVKAFYLTRSTGKGAEAVVSVILDRAIGIAGMAAVALIALLIGGSALAGLPTARPFFFPIIALVAGVFFGLGLFFLIGFTTAPAAWLLKLVKWRRLREKVERVHRTLSLLRGKPAVLARAFAVSTGIWVLIVVICWLVYMAFRAGSGAPTEGKIATIPIGFFFLFIPAISVASSQPITFAGWGTREALFVILFSAIPGVGRLDALFLSLNYFLIFLVNALVGGLIYIFKDQLHFHQENLKAEGMDPEAFPAPLGDKIRNPEGEGE